MQGADGERTLEGALASAEADAGRAMDATKRLLRVMTVAVKGARTGDLAALGRAMSDAEDALGDVAERVGEFQDGWAFPDEASIETHFASGAFTRELVAAAREHGLGLYEQGDALACFPSLVRVIPRSRAVSIDRRPVRTVRPSYLAARLLAAQRREPKLRTGQFLETILAAYRLLTKREGGVVKLVDVYRALTLLPTARADYGVQEFARDVYLLDGSGVVDARDGSRMRLMAGATGAKSPSGLLVVVTREGVERTYYGVEFTPGG